MRQLAEQRIKQQYLSLKKERTQKGLRQKSDLEEAMSCYYSENYRAAFIMAYVHVIGPVAINSKRLHKRKNREKFLNKKDPFKFNLITATEECVFLTEELKSELSKTYKVTLKFPEKIKDFTFSLSQIRNITVHPEDDKHRFAKNQLNYKAFALHLLDLAPRIHDEYHYYLKSQGNEKRKTKEKKAYKEIYAVS